jgi:glycosyltransferase involved in cell wall biosynthesis
LLPLKTLSMEFSEYDKCPGLGYNKNYLCVAGHLTLIIPSCKPIKTDRYCEILMRVLYVLSENINRTDSGIVHFLAVARNLKKLGHDVVVLGPKYNFKMRRLPDIKGVYVPLPGRNVVSALLFFIIIVPMLPFLKLIYRPQAMLIRGGGIDIFWMLCGMGRLLGIKVVVEANGVSWEEVRARGFSSFFVLLTKLSAILEVKLSDAVICVTSAIGDELVRASGIPPEKVTAIHNGADPNEFTRDNRLSKRFEMSIRPDELVVGYIGNFSPWHGTKEIIESALYLNPEVRQKVIYLMVGDGVSWQKAKQMIAEKCLENTVKLPGHASREQIVDYLSVFDVGVLIISCWEKAKTGTSPLKFWEYLASGLPVIISDDISLTPIVQGENMGIVLENSSPENIARSIEEIFNRREEFEEIGKRNRKLVNEKYSWLEVSKRVAEVLADDRIS